MDASVSPAAHAAALWAGLIVILMLVLSLLVVRQRRRFNVAVGDDGVPDLVRAVRAFGNASEYAPLGVAGLGLLALVGANVVLVHLVGALLFSGRLAHAFGLTLSTGDSTARLAGMLLTWIAFLISAALLLFYSVP